MLTWRRQVSIVGSMYWQIPHCKNRLWLLQARLIVGDPAVQSSRPNLHLLDASPIFLIKCLPEVQTHTSFPYINVTMQWICSLLTHMCSTYSTPKSGFPSTVLFSLATFLQLRTNIKAIGHWRSRNQNEIHLLHIGHIGLTIVVHTWHGFGKCEYGGKWQENLSNWNCSGFWLPLPVHPWPSGGQPLCRAAHNHGETDWAVKWILIS